MEGKRKEGWNGNRLKVSRIMNRKTKRRENRRRNSDINKKDMKE